MSHPKRATLAGLAVAGLVVVGGAGAALTANADTPSPTPSASSSAGTGRPDAGGDRGGHQHTAASAAETTRVKEAVKAKDSAITVEKVEKDPDGSYDVKGAKAGDRVRVEVSKDLKTVTVDTRGPGGHGGHGGHGEGHGPRGTAVSTAETTQVKDAVKAKDSAITVEHVVKEADGSFRAFGTKAGSTGDGHVMVEVSKDLETVTVHTGGPGGRGHHGHHGRAGERQQGQQADGNATTPQPSASATRPA